MRVAAFLLAGLLACPVPAAAQFVRAVEGVRTAPIPLEAPAGLPAALPTAPAASLAPTVLPSALPVLPSAAAFAAAASPVRGASALPAAGPAAFAAPAGAASAAADGPSERRAPSARAQLESMASAEDAQALWTGAVPARQARAQLRRAHWQTFKFFMGSRVGLLRDMIRQQETETAGRPRAVKDLEGMWLDWRTKGYTGKVQTAGFETADRVTVRREAEGVFARYFPKDAEVHAAFRRYLDRVEAYVPAARPSNYRKLAFGIFYEAPTQRPEALAAQIDATLSEEHLAEIRRWRAERQDAVLASFKQAALGTLSEVNRALPAGKRVVAMILLGSYSIGQSTPKSDVDFQLVTQDGSSDAIAPFKEALERNWTTDRVEKLEAFQFALPPSPEVVKDSFPEGYVVISPDPAAVKALTFKTAPRAPTAWTRLRGKAFEWGYKAWIRAWFAAASAREALGR